MAQDISVDVEALPAAIDAADKGYSIELVSLTKAGRIYALDLRDGADLIMFEDYEGAQEHATRCRSLARAQAALDFLSAHRG